MKKIRVGDIMIVCSIVGVVVLLIGFCFGSWDAGVIATMWFCTACLLGGIRELLPKERDTDDTEHPFDKQARLERAIAKREEKLAAVRKNSN
jgi:hypothetical protein